MALVALLVTPPPSAMAATTFHEGEQHLTSLVEWERSSGGVGPLQPHPDLAAAARRQAHAMADAGRLFHTPDLGSVTEDWTRIGENVAVAGSVEEAHRALMASSAHRANILDPRFTHLGVGVVADGSRVWVVEIFIRDDFTPPFSDDDGLVHESNIARLAAAGITEGCGGTRFCPHAAVSREQMATFLDRALGLPSSGVDHYGDDDGSMHEGSINTTTTAGITSGCAPGRYCPTANLSRADMAVFLASALDLPPAARDHFWDDSGWPQEDAINRIADAGITRGCESGRFCPGGAVTRAQMASFLVRALGL